MNRIDFAALSPAEVLAVVAHEARHCLVKDGEGLEALFDQIPVGSRHAALRTLFDLSVEELSGVLLAFTLDRGLLALPGFTEGMDVALQLRDRFFSHPCPFLDTGHFDLLKSLAGPLGLDFSINSMEDAYSERHLRGYDAVDAVVRIDAFTKNLTLAKSFCDPETLRDKAVGNAALRRFAVHAENAVANDPAYSAMRHLRILAELDFDDMGAMLDVISASEIERLPTILQQYMGTLFSKFDSGLEKFYVHALRPAFSYVPATVFDHLETLSDQALRRLVNSEFLDAYLNRKWLSLDECNGFLMEDTVFMGRLEKFNSRLLADPYIKNLLKDHCRGEMHVSKLMATPQMEEAGLTLSINCPKEYNLLARQLIIMKGFRHLNEYYEKGRQLIESGFADQAKTMYSRFYFSGAEVPDPETMSSSEIVQASLVLMACDYGLFVKGNNSLDAPRFIDGVYRNQSMESTATLYLDTMPDEQVVQLVKNVPQYLRCLLNSNLIDRKYLQQLSPEDLTQQFGQDLGL
ncbi:hypothetical protein [Pseudomonas serbica]|uniref:hypothetical protein n=1 Tax=Pseudomonas serbica TaxID=2965074 RepID=UPI00237A4BC3|nr:hypothetical protein [Pseudomonas serbica]